MALSLIPYGIIQTLEAMSSSRRIAAFLDSAEQLPHALHGQVMRMTDVLVAWTPTAHLDKRCARKLEILDFKFSSPGLSLIFGMRGSGKSMLLSAIIGEASILRGVLHIPRSTKTECSTSLPRRTSAIAYVGSQPWIERGTIKDTVLFGAPYDAIRYAEVLHAVALDADINGMQRGDLTDVGVQGNNLSGGQKLRLTLARALYSSASLLVIDDILGSLDARTKSHVVSHGLFGSLADNRTLILASNEPSMFLARSDCAIELLDPDAPILYTSNAECVERLRAMSPAKKSTMTSIDRRLDNDVASIDTNGDAADEEHVESGHVPWRLYSRYLYSAGRPCFWALALLVVGLSQAAFLARNFSLAAWTSPVTLTDTTSSSRSHATMTYMGFYVGASVLAAILEAAKCAVFYEGALSASANLYDKMASGILGASLQWLNGTPGGRIQNRMSADSALMDAKLPGDGHMFFSSIFGLLIVSIAGLLVSPIIFIPEVILGLLGLWYSFVYLQAARSTRRLDAVTRSPVLDLLGTCRLGLPTIRAFRKQKQYISRMGRYLDDQSRASTAFWLVYLWMDFRMGMLGAAFILIIAVYTAFADIDASLAGLVLTLALGYSTHAEEAIARYASLQLDMNAIERIVEYADLPQEDYSGRELAQDWPQSGRIIVRNLYASYDPDAPSVLKAINLDIPAGGRVGIVGRTGSGKSSLAQALLRLLPAKLGCITIDGLNIEEITLTELRSRICLVPQDPVLFTGDIRYNLDPEATSSDVALYNALHTVGLASSAPIDAEDDSSSATQGQVLRLGTAVTEAGSNLSQSQRQLICLARGLVRKCRIVILDEATSSVDKESDCIIQSRLQGVFMDSTVIVIAHRLSTVASFDLIAVMEAGRVAEYGPPQQLYKAKGAFRNLVEHSIEALELRRSLDT
ncbi:ABC transporter-like protein 3 [Elsinoe fawcettii]|nr:ABC transporter-like protein 3 [Elsinoe fawcettii]